jgi:cephalosporin hydroxylase
MSRIRQRISDLAWRMSSDQPEWPELPDPVQANWDEPPVAAYWRARLAQHTDDSYVGIPMSKFPEDLRVYEHLLWLSQANVVIEVGSYYGGSALWLRDRLRAFAGYGRIRNPRVVSIDLDVTPARRAIQGVDPGYAETIALVDGDIRDPATRERIAAEVPAGSRCLVIEDSAHTYEATMAALTQLAGFVPRGGFFVVEDGCVDVPQLRIDPEWPQGVIPAVEEWLASDDGREFTVRRDLELYGVSCHPSGFLQRSGAGS